MAEVYVLALVGTSPAVVTELLWHLVKAGHTVVGVEVWTTTVGAAKLREFHDKLYRLKRTYDDVLPSITDESVEAAGPEGSLTEGIRIVVPRRDTGASMGDIRSPEDAALFTEKMHERVFELADTLGDTRLFGGVAGGRKTMSIAMQSAFTLHGRWEDPLLHVLVHPEIEKRLNPRHPEHHPFAFPEGEIFGLPEDRQVTVYEVPTLPLRGWLDPATARKSFHEVWGELSAMLCGAPSARLVEGALEIFRGDTRIARLELSKVRYDVLRTLVELGGDAAPGKIRPGHTADATRAVVKEIVKQMKAARVWPIAKQFAPEWDGDGHWVIDGEIQLM